MLSLTDIEDAAAALGLGVAEDHRGVIDIEGHKLHIYSGKAVIFHPSGARSPGLETGDDVRRALKKHGADQKLSTKR